MKKSSRKKPENLCEAQEEWPVGPPSQAQKDFVRRMLEQYGEDKPRPIKAEGSTTQPESTSCSQVPRPLPTADSANPAASPSPSAKSAASTNSRLQSSESEVERLLESHGTCVEGQHGVKVVVDEPAGGKYNAAELLREARALLEHLQIQRQRGSFDEEPEEVASQSNNVATSTPKRRRHRVKPEEGAKWSVAPPPPEKSSGTSKFEKLMPRGSIGACSLGTTALPICTGVNSSEEEELLQAAVKEWELKSELTKEVAALVSQNESREGGLSRWAEQGFEPSVALAHHLKSYRSISDHLGRLFRKLRS